MSPDASYNSQQTDAESKILADKVAALDEESKHKVYDMEVALKMEQVKKADTSCLPTLTMSDLNPTPQPYALSKLQLGANKIPVHIFPQPTNGVTHFRGLLDTSKVPSHLRDGYLPLFLNIATRMGTKKHDYRQFDRKIQLTTSGLGISSHIHEHPEDQTKVCYSILLSSLCLDRNASRMMDLWQELFSGPSFTDRERLETLIKSTAAELANGIAYGGHRYAMLNASSRLTAAARTRERHSGLAFIAQMKKFAAMDKEGMEETLARLQVSYVFVINPRSIQ